MQKIFTHLVQMEDWGLAILLVLVLLAFAAASALLMVGVYFELRREDRSGLHGIR